MKENTHFRFSKQSIADALLLTIFSIGWLFGAAGAAQAAGAVTLVAVPTSNTVTVGQSANYTIKINHDNYTDKVTLSATGLPAGSTANFTPNTTTANSSTLKVQTAANTPIGVFNITVKGTANGITIAPIIVKLTTKAQPAVSIAVLPAVQSIIAGQETSFEVAINRLNFDGAVTLSAANLPSGITVRFEPETTYGSTAQMFLYSGGLPTSLGEGAYTIDVRAAALQLIIKNLKLTLYVNCGMIWVRQFAAPNPQTGTTENCRHPATGAAIACPEIATAVTEDAAGNVYVAGRTDVPDASGNILNPSNFDAFVAKYDSAGNRLGIWVFANPITQDFATDVAVDAAGNVFVAGYKQTNNDRTTAGVFIAKVAANGTTSQMSGTISFGFGEDGTGGMHLRADGSGGAVMTTTVNLQRRHGRFDGEDFYEASFDIRQIPFDGNLVSGTSSVVASNVGGDPVDLAVGTDGSVNVAGNYDVFPFPPDDYPRTYLFAAKFAQTSGVWQQAWRNEVSASNTTLRNYVAKIAVAANGDVFVGGNDYLSHSPFSAWIKKIRADGCDTAACGVWRRSFDGSNTTIAALEVDADGDVYYGGTTFGALAITRPPLNESDAWFAKSLGSTGELIYIRQFDAVNKDELNAIKVGLNKDLLLAGYTVLFTGANFGYEDALLMKYRLEGIVRNPPFNPAQLGTRVTGINPSTVRSGANFALQGIFGDVKAVFLNGRPVSFTSNGAFSSLQAQAPIVSATTNFNVTVSTGCRQVNAPVQLTVTP